MAVTPFKLVTPRTAAMLTQRADQELARWSADWLPDEALRFTCCNATDAGSRAHIGWRRHRLEDGTPAWIGMPEEGRRLLHRLLFKIDRLTASDERHLSSAIAEEAMIEAIDDLESGLLQATTGCSSRPDTGEPPPAALFRHGSGAILCTLEAGATGMLFMLLPSSAVPAPAPVSALFTRQQMPLTGLREALSASPVHLTVELGEAELSLGHLGHLAVGSVLALSIPLDQPMAVKTPDGTTLCRGHLGSVGDKLALDLIKA